MLLFLKNNGLSHDDLVSFHSMIESGGYDTDAVQQDIAEFEETVDGGQSNIWSETANARLMEMMKKYDDLAKGIQSLCCHHICLFS